MKKPLALLLAVALTAGLALLAGCGQTTTIKTEEENVKVTEKGSQVEIEEEGNGKEETTEVTTEVPTEAELGAPVYPGAEMDENAAGTVSTKNEKGETVYMAAAFWTDDPVDKVITWYRDALKDKPGFIDMSSTQGGESVGLFQFSSGDTAKMVTIAKGDVDHPGQAVIAITGAQGVDVSSPR